MTRHMATSPRPRLMLLGTGWSTFALAKHIDYNSFDVTIVSPRNHMVFTPLLASTAVGTLEFRSISLPAPSSFPRAQYIKAAATRVDLTSRTVQVRSAGGDDSVDPPAAVTASIPFDLLVVGVGAVNNTFGIPGVAEHMHFLKELPHARAIRRAIIRNVEAAAFPGLPHSEVRRLLSFVIVGGGPTGVEFAAELHDFIMEDLMRLYPRVAGEVHITIIEGKHILGAFDQSLREYTESKFRRDRITLRTGVNVARVEAGKLYLSDGDSLEYGMGVWNTGIGPVPLVRDLDAGIARDPWGHLLTDDCLRVRTAGADGGGIVPGVWAMGDCASVGTHRYAATAQVAEQQGTYLAKQLNSLATNFSSDAESNEQGTQSVMAAAASASLPQFQYKHGGSLAFIGTFSAISDFSSATRVAPLHGARLRGIVAWLLWRSAYLTQLGAWRNRFQVPVDWLRTLLFGRDVTQF